MSIDPVWRAYQRATELPVPQSPCAVPAHSAIMLELADQISEIASEGGPVLIIGEAGLAKGCHADAIHFASTRHSKTLASVNCIGLGREDFEQLFVEDERVPSDGAGDSRVLRAARGGTLFFNEVGALDSEMQEVLQHILTEGRLPARGGGRSEVRVDARIIASSTVDLVEAVNSGSFREDLYYRLSAITLSIPPIRVRGDEDVMELLSQIARTLAAELHGAPSRFDPHALMRLIRYPWPGNIREMRNAIERAMIAARGQDAIALAHLPAELRDPLGFDGEYVPRTLAQLEQLHIERTLRRHRQNRTHAAAELGISRATLIKKIREYGLNARTASRRPDDAPARAR